jgi:hypothetical protein
MVGGARVNCGPIYHPSPEEYEAMWELAEFCGLSVEDMFGVSLPKPSAKEAAGLLAPVAPSVVDVLHSLRLGCVTPGDVFHIHRESFFDLLREPTFVTLDKYAPNVTIHPDEAGRFYGMPVILSDSMPNDVVALVKREEMIWRSSTTTNPPMPPKQKPMVGAMVWK